MDLEIEAQNGEVMADPPAKTRPKPPRSLGRPEFDTDGLIAFNAKPPSSQKEEIKASWASAAYILAERLKRFSMTVSRKDFGRLQQLATSAGVAYDKVFPKGEHPVLEASNNVIFNLFGNLGGEQVMRILQPAIPTLPVPVKELTNGISGQTDREACEQAPGQDLQHR